MSGILAIFERGDREVGRKVGEAMLAAADGRAVDGSNYWSNGPVALGHHHFWVTPEEQNENQPLVLGNGRLAITADVRLDNRTELIADLNLDPVMKLSDSMLILLSYQRWSVDCVNHLDGDFAFAIWDASEQHLYVARDPLGVRQIYYILNKNLLLVATEIESLLAHPAVDSCVNRERVAEYLALQMDYDRETFFEGIYYCPPAHCLLVSTDLEREWRYWPIDPSYHVRYKDSREYTEHFLMLLRHAVHERLRCVGPVGVSLSGGLDSTSVAAIAAKELGANHTKLHSYSVVFQELVSCDESEFILPVVQRYGLEANNVLSDDAWPLRDLLNWPVLADPVSIDPYWWLIIGLMKSAQQDKMRVMLTGHFGDGLFEGAAYWAADMLRDLRFRELWRTIRTSGGMDPRQHLIDNGLRQFIPLQARHLYRRIRPRNETMHHYSMHPELANNSRLHERLWERRPPDGYGATSHWNRYRDLTLGILPPMMAAIMTMWNQYGIEHLEPMRDRQLVEYVLSVPADQLGFPGPGNNKRLLRVAMNGLLPDAVRLRHEKTSFTALYLRGLMDRERGTVERILHEPEIVRRGFVNPDWLTYALPHGCNFSDEGFSLWRCVTLELWLKRFHPR